MNLRNYSGDYNIGLDMGTGSVGWAAVDEHGQLLHFKKQPTWGSRLFDSAQTAATARIPRSQRRRYVRRRWRLDLLQGLFQDEIAKVDPDFFIRLRQSRLLKEDRAEGHADYRYPLFNDSDFTERDYYAKFPTIYHLRKWLMEVNEKADIRLIYLAMHNIVKHRGNFLRQGQQLSAKTADPSDAIDDFFRALDNWCDSRGYSRADHSAARGMLDVLKEERSNPSSKKKAIADLLDLSIGDDAKEDKNCRSAIAAAMVGLKADFSNIFGDFSAEQTSIKLSDDEAVELLRDAVPDDSGELFDAICNVYSAYLLQGLLSYVPGETISANMVEKYNQYGEDLRILKSLVREYVPAKYDGFFRGPKYDGTNDYDVDTAQGYTRYNLGVSKLDYDKFKAEVKKLFAGTSAEADARYQNMMAAFENQQFLRRLKTSDNGSIYYQLHLEELHDILLNQGRFYPFLLDDMEKIESLVTFRIPYYVGPLSTRNAAVDHNGKQRFAWSERREGQESTPIMPWNWDKVVDTGKSAEKFILRMTGTCTYLQGEDVLPRCSLLYEEFCVLNELNGLHVSCDGDEEHRLDAADREGIIQELFRHKRSVKYKDIEKWLIRNSGFPHVHVWGGQGEAGLESKLGSYIFFCKDVFRVNELREADYDMVEEIILWSTLFEDRSILRVKLAEKYGVENGGPLDDGQIATICRKRFTGWGRLSRKFLTGLKVQTEAGPKSLMDVLREGDPNSGTKRGRTLVMMEALRDEDLGFQQRVDDFNKQYFKEHNESMTVNDLPGSPAIRRSINQAVRIVDEITKIAGHEPKNIFIEVARDEDSRNKGRRTRRRYESLLNATQKLQEEYAQEFDRSIMAELKENATGNGLDSERLVLYFMQHGKCLYSGRPIDITRLSTGDYEVDHIIPRAYIKDDSFENKALVYREENQRKTNELLIEPAIRRRMGSYWKMLHDAGLIGDKKYRNLLRDHIDDKMMKGFINRQIVETSQMVKLIQTMLAARYDQTRIVPVKASMSHNLREAAGLVKCREANDFHHAHDAFLACRVGLFIQMRHPGVYDNPIGLSHAIRSYVRNQADEYKKTHHMPGSAGFVINSFMTSGFDKDTGEVFKDTWDAEAEVEGIRRALNYRQCYISRMPYEDTGVFWDATIYSPRSGKNLALPLKEGLDPEKYGSYSREQFAYFFVYEAVKRGKNGKGKRQFRFAQVPVWLAKKIEGDSRALEAYAKRLAADEGLEFVRIERAKILKRQLIEIDGDRLMITGAREARNAVEVAFQIPECNLLDNLVTGGSAPVEQLGEVWRRLILLTESKMPHSAHSLKLREREDAFLGLSTANQGKLLLGVIAVLNASTNVVDLSLVGGPQNAGRVLLSYSKVITDQKTSFLIIDQSVTGMFEKRTRIGL